MCAADCVGGQRSDGGGDVVGGLTELKTSQATSMRVRATAAKCYGEITVMSVLAALTKRAELLARLQSYSRVQTALS